MSRSCRALETNKHQYVTVGVLLYFISPSEALCCVPANYYPCDSATLPLAPELE